MPIHCKFLYIVISLVLVDFHANAGQIAISKNPSKFEKTAADELKYFLNQIGDSEYKIILETDVSGENIIYLHTSRFHSYIREDSESPTGHTYSSEHPDSKMHGKDARQKNLMAATFGIYKYGKDQKTIQITEFPSDEKYHWYKIPRFEIGSKTMFWGHFWFIQYDISSAYANADGLKDGNVWDIWFSAKFTGPAYVKGSKKKNAVCVDMVVLTKP